MADLGKLPAEVRNAIYGQLFCGGGSEARESSRSELTMFTVSKQLHGESSSYFYGNNEMIINIPSLPTATATKLPPIADRYLPFLKRLTLHVPAGPAQDLETPYIATAIEMVSGIGAELTELKLVLTSYISRHLNSRVDDSVLDAAHPVTNAIHRLLQTNVATIVRITLNNAWFAPDVAQVLKIEFGSKVEFYQDDVLVQNPTAIERAILGRFASQHLTNLGLDEESVSDLSRKRGSTPDNLALSSSPSSLCSVLCDLDMFSVSSFGSGADITKPSGYDDSFEAPSLHEPFFSEDDIEGWSSGTQDESTVEEDDFEMDLDDELEDVPKDEVDAFMRNMGAVAEQNATDIDIDFLTNFAPELLLSKAQLI